VVVETDLWSFVPSFKLLNPVREVEEEGRGGPEEQGAALVEEIDILSFTDEHERNIALLILCSYLCSLVAVGEGASSGGSTHSHTQP
jgi:hypothetical protein